MILSLFAATKGEGYIAGLNEGIVTVRGIPAQRETILLDAISLQVVQRSRSLPTGNYIFIGLDTNRAYILMARDFKKEFEPFVWDHVRPATDISAAEQWALWQSWQNK